MIGQKVIKIISTFSREELRKFGSFLNSPYFNSSKRLIKLFNVLKLYYPAFNNSLLTKERIYKKVFPGKTFNDGTLRSLMIHLENKARLFVSVECSLADHSTDPLLKYFSDKNLAELFKLEYIKSRDDLKKRRKTVKMDFYREFKIEAKRYNFILLNEKMTKRSIAGEMQISLELSFVSLINFFLMELINISIHSERDNMQVKENDDSAFIARTLKAFNLPKIYNEIKSKNPYDNILKIYIAIYEMYLNSDKPEQYYTYRSLIKKNINDLNPDELSFHYSNLISYSLKMIFSKNNFEIRKEFQIELMILYKELLKNGYYKSEKCDFVTPILFRNILLSSLKLKEYKWIYSLIQHSEKYLHKKDVENVKKLSFAYYYFEMKDFRKTLVMLRDFKGSSFIFIYDIKNLTVKAYYELGYFDEALSYINSYKVFLKRNLLVTEENKIRYTNFLNYTEKIINSFNKNKDELGFLKVQIAQSDITSFKDWLIEKIDQKLLSPTSILNK